MNFTVEGRIWTMLSEFSPVEYHTVERDRASSTLKFVSFTLPPHHPGQRGLLQQRRSSLHLSRIKHWSCRQCLNCSNALLTYSMMQSPSWEANWFAASQEIPRISRKPKVHYRTHKRPPPISILGPPNPVHIPTSHLLEIHTNIIHPSMPMPPQWSVHLRLLHPDPIHPLLLTHTRHMPSPSHSSRSKYHILIKCEWLFLSNKNNGKTKSRWGMQS